MTFHGFFDIIDSIVDDAVEPDINSFPLGKGVSLDFRPDIESYDDGIGGRSKVNVRLVNRTDTGMDYVQADGGGRKLAQRFADSLDRTLYVTFYYDVEILDLACLDLGVEIFKRQFCVLGKFLFALFDLAEGCDFFCLALILQGDKNIAGIRNA